MEFPEIKFDRIKSDSRIRNILELTQNDTPLILCNKSTHLDVYTPLLEYKYTINLSIYALLILKLKDSRLLILSYNQEFQICLFKNRNLEIIKTGKIQGYVNESDNFITKYSSDLKYYINDNIIFLYNKKDIKSYKLINNQLIVDDTPNDLCHYEILFMSWYQNRLNLIVKDIENSIYLLKYSINNKLKLNKKTKKYCLCIFEYKAGYLIINDTSIYYEVNNKKVCESEFGNNKIMSYIEYEGKVIMSMRDGEIIIIEVLDRYKEAEKIEKDVTNTSLERIERQNRRSMHDTETSENITNSQCKDNVKVYTFDIQVYKMDVCFSALFMINKNLLCHSFTDRCYLLNITNKVNIINYIDSVACLSCTSTCEEVIEFYNSKYKCELRNRIPVRKLNSNILEKDHQTEISIFSDMSGNNGEFKYGTHKDYDTSNTSMSIYIPTYYLNIHNIISVNILSFFLFDDLLVVTLDDHTRVYENDKELYRIEKIDNYHVYDKSLYMNSSRILYNIEDKKLRYKEVEEILICKYNKGEYLIYNIRNELQKGRLTDMIEYTNDNKDQPCDNTSNQCQLELQGRDARQIIVFPYNISCIIFDNYIYISTYEDKFVVLNDKLETISICNRETFLKGVLLNGRLFVYNLRNEIVEIQCNTYNKNFHLEEKVFMSIKDLQEITIIDEKIFYLTSKSIYCNDKILDISNVRCITKYREQYYISKGNRIIVIALSETCEYKWKVTEKDYIYKDSLLVCRENSIRYMCKDTRLRKNKIGNHKWRDRFPFSLEEGEYVKKCINIQGKKYIILTNKYKYTLEGRRVLSKDKSVLDLLVYDTRVDDDIFDYMTKKGIHMDTQICPRDTYMVIEYSHEGICVADKELVYTSVIESVYTNYGYILIIDLFRGYTLYDTRSNKYMMNDTCIKFHSGCLYMIKGLIHCILSDDRYVYVYDTNHVMVMKYLINDRVVSFSTSSLEVNNECIYLMTEGSSIYKMFI